LNNSFVFNRTGCAVFFFYSLNELVQTSQLYTIWTTLAMWYDFIHKKEPVHLRVKCSLI